MFASLIISIKADIKRAKEKKQLRQKKKAQERIENNEGTASDEKIAKKPVKRSFYVFNKIKAAVVGFFESIPIVFILTKILIFVLIIALILAILAAFISTMAQAVTDMTVEASETLVFSNAFDEIKSESKAYSDGSIRTIITYTKKEVSSDDDSDDSSDDSGDDITITTNDVAFWCELSDAQIQKNIIEEMEKANKPKNEINMTANLARFIRMAYRVCYAGNETGTNPEKRILKNIEPYTLLGIVFYEKGYNWLQAQSGTAVTGNSAADYWCHYDKNNSEWKDYDVEKDNPGYDKMNIDDSVSGLFLYENKLNTEGERYYVDGPYSLSAWTKNRGEHKDGSDTVPVALAKALNGDVGKSLYTALTNPSGSYKAYDLSAFVIENGSEIKIKESEKTDNNGDGYAVASVLPSMILTALNFEANYVPAYQDRYESDVCEFNILAGTDEPSGDIVAYYLQTAIGLNSEIPGYTEVYNRYKRGLVNLAFYSYHHMSGFTSAIYNNLTLDGKIPTSDDWYKSQALILLSVIHSCKGNIAAVTLNDMRDVKSFTSKDFHPFSVDMTNYKSTIAGIWYWFYNKNEITYSEKTYTSTDFVTNVKCNPSDAELKFYDFTTFTSSDVVSPTLIGYALDNDILFKKNSTLKNKIITAQSIPADYESLDFYYPNLHAMLPEGIYAATTGNDLIYHFISAFGIGNSKPSSGTPGLAYDGKRWLTNGLFKGFDNKPQQGILPFLDVTIDDTKLVLGNTSDYKWELVLNEGVGYYKNDYTATHRGLDYVPKCISGATYDDYSMPLLTAAASLYENSGGKYTKLSDAFKKYGYKGTSDFYTDMRTQVSGLPENDFRIPIVSIADGYVKSISYSDVESSMPTSLGCCVSVRYIVLVGDTEEYIDVTYSHMGADLPFLWDREYLQGKLAAELAETGLLGISFNYPGKFRGSGDYFKIKCGDILGYTSSTGASSVGHLHFAMYDSEGKSEIDSDGSNERKGEICSALFGMRTGDWKMDGYYPFADEWLVKFYSRTNGKAFPDATVSYWNIPSDVLHKILLSPNLDAAAKLFTD